jgi:hypothetical protein
MSNLEPVTTNHKNTTIRNGQNKEYDHLRKEIDLVDKWSNYGANNGLFNGKNNNNSYNGSEENTNVNIQRDKHHRNYAHNYQVNGEAAYINIHEQLKIAKDDLNGHKFTDCVVHTSLARLFYLKTLYSKSWGWRFVNLYAGPVWIYLATFLALVMAFYAYYVDVYLQDTRGVDQAAIHAVTWGCIGSILRGMWYLKDKVSEREYKNSWWIYFVSTPFLGGIFGAIVYLVLIAGLLSLGVGQSSNEGLPQINRPLVIVPIAALAGFNWEWAVKMFRRIGDLFTPSSDPIK